MNKALLMALLVIWLPSVFAAHITDKLVVGLYESSEISDKPIKLHSSGTPLEVLKRNKGFSQVRLSDDTKGWVESSYVTEVKPASMMLLEAQAEIRQLKAKSSDASSIEGSNNLPSIEDVKSQQALATANTRIAELEEDLKDLPAARAAEIELAELKSRVGNVLELLADGQGVELKAMMEESKPESFVMKYLPWIVSVFAVVIGFAAGIGFIDYRIRKRYGGFRI